MVSENGPRPPMGMPENQPVKAKVRARLCKARGKVHDPGLDYDEYANQGSVDVSVEVRSEITGKVWKIEAKEGQSLSEDDPIVILESMKMEIPVPAPSDGTVVEILVAEEDVVNEGDVVAIFEQA